MQTKLQSLPLKVLLAEDDTDDRLFFEQALKGIPIPTWLVNVHNGEQVMDYLAENSEDLPDILFLDLSMPRKTGFECLSEIKENKKFNDIPVTVFSTSFTKGIALEQNLITTLLGMGATTFIRKTSDLVHFKSLLEQALRDALDKRNSKENARNRTNA